MEKLDGKSMDIVSENIAKLKELFPDVFSEGKVDFGALEATLGEYVDVKEERYSFNWNGKAKARRIAQTPSTGTLRPAKEESKNWDSTENLYIEGDNLEVLKLLQKSYHKQVKMIYIDPPYNTGKDFVYKDNFKDNIKNYLEITGQVDSEGNKLSTNSDTSGRYHSDWLNMMYPRLKLARNLLRDDGVIFISIDDNEVSNLRKICDEIFGEDNFVGEFIWKRRASSAMADNNVSADHEYVLAYQKGCLDGFLGIKKDFKNYKNPDNDSRGSWVLGDLTVGMTASMRPNQAYDLVDPKTGNIFPFNPNRVWAYIPSSMKKMIDEGRVSFPDDASKRPMQKRFKNELKSTHNPLSTILINKVGLNTEATRQIQQIMGGNVFDYSKPLSLLSTLISQMCNDNDLVLDFFAGSSASAHAVIQYNAEVNGRIKYIMVQLPEEIDEKSEAYKAGYKNICEIGKERIRRAGDKIVGGETSVSQKDGAEAPSPLDIGFKVFKLDSSNIKAWDPESDNLEQSLFEAVNNIKSDRTEEDLLYEILLKYGLDLTLPIEELELAGKKVYVVGLGALVICLDEQITLDTVEEIAKLKEQYEADDLMRVVFRDNGFKDAEVKTNAIQILKQSGIDDVKSL